MKYYKVDDVSRAIIELPNAENGYSGSYDKAEILNALEDLPTIEASEDCIDRKALLEQKYKAKDIFDTEYEDWFVFVPTIENAPSVVPTSENKCHRHGIRLEDGTPIYECIGCDKQDCERRG